MADKYVWVAPLGISFVAFSLAGAIGVESFAGRVLVVLALMSVLFAIGGSLKILFSGRRDKYDLNLLREVHEKAELNQAGDDYVSPEADEVVCIRCTQTYGTRFPACPHCGHVPGIH
jgi:hypothetical protein